MEDYNLIVYTLGGFAYVDGLQFLGRRAKFIQVVMWKILHMGLIIVRSARLFSKLFRKVRQKKFRVSFKGV